MDESVLLVTSQTSLEDVVRKALTEVGKYDLRATNDFNKIIEDHPQQHIAVALLDAELEEQGVSILDVGRALRQLNNKVQIIVITNPRSWLTEEINELAPRGYISKPLDAAELAKMMNTGKPTNPKVEPASQRSVPVEVSAEIPWLQDINRAAQHLTRLTLESSAVVASAIGPVAGGDRRVLEVGERPPEHLLELDQRPLERGEARQAAPVGWPAGRGRSVVHQGRKIVLRIHPAPRVPLPQERVGDRAGPGRLGRA